MTTKPPRSPRIKEERKASKQELSTIEFYIERSVPDKHKIATRRALLGQVPKSGAIKVKCLQCCGYQREEIKVCAVITCALHPVRPYQGRETLPEDTEEV